MSNQFTIYDLQFLISCIYFFLPAYLANMVPPLAKRFNILNFLAFPIDLNKKFLGKPIFGSHKTLRGAVLSFFVGFLVVIFQNVLYRFDFFKEISILNYSEINLSLFAFLMSFGVVFGDLFFAFVKRRIGLKPGAPFLPFDQTNYVFGAFLFLQPYLKLDLRVWFLIFILTFFLHIIFNRVGYILRIHNAKW